jgi:hypothetical protein
MKSLLLHMALFGHGAMSDLGPLCALRADLETDQDRSSQAAVSQKGRTSISRTALEDLLLPV